MSDAVKTEGEDEFQYTTRFINDELDLLHGEQENVVTLSTQIESAFSQTDNMKRFLKILKDIDDLLLKDIKDRRKTESSGIHLMEDIKDALSRQRYEDIDKMLRKIHSSSQDKIHLTQAELASLREMINKLNDLYNEITGFQRLLQAIYARITKVYEQCQLELSKEMSEEAALSRAGSSQPKGWLGR